MKPQLQIKRVDTAELMGDDLNWAVAMCEGDYLGPDGKTACNADIENLEVPFTLYDLNYQWDGETLVGVVVEPITVIRYGILKAYGATAPSIDIKYKNGDVASSSADMFYLTPQEANNAQRFALANCCIADYVGDANLSMAIIEREGIALRQYRQADHQILEVRHFDESQGDNIRHDFPLNREMVYRPVQKKPVDLTWYAQVSNSSSTVSWDKKLHYTGPTPVVAALRCYVGMSQGEFVEIRR